MKHGGGSVMAWAFMATSGTDVLILKKMFCKKTTTLNTLTSSEAKYWKLLNWPSQSPGT